MQGALHVFDLVPLLSQMKKKIKKKLHVFDLVPLLQIKKN
jgi:hypothetical protein